MNQQTFHHNMIVKNTYNFNYQWKFKIAHAFPLQNALHAHLDSNGAYFYEKKYIEDSWSDISLPHTFNDSDSFVNRIEDAGTNQLRTFSFYRKWLTLPKDIEDKKILIEFEGMRQSCYLYLNGKLVGYYECGVAPFAFDLSHYIEYDSPNLIAIATDNTSTRNVEFCMAETPNYDDVLPGEYLANLVGDSVDEDKRGVGYFWNCNDFNPSLGGISRNVKLHIKPRTYLTLPIYSNLMTKGTYIYSSDYLIEDKQANIHIEAEIRNESSSPQNVHIETLIVDQEGTILTNIVSLCKTVRAVNLPIPPKSIVPKDAYKKLGNHYVALEEDQVSPTVTDSLLTETIYSNQTVNELKFWSTQTPYLYTVYTNLYVNQELVDTITISTGFRKVDYHPDLGLLINNQSVWLTGYAQRSSNEWAAIGIAPDWLKDMDAKLIRESNANHIRFMHVAASPADIRSCDSYGIVVTQPAGDKERENFGRQWDQRIELMRDIIIYFRNNPSILFWEAGNNSINKEHMREMRLLKECLDPNGGRMMGCRTLSTEDVVEEAEYVGTMLNRHAGRFQSLLMPITETEYLREESPRRVWDDFSPPDYDYDNIWLGRGGRKQMGGDCHDLTQEEFALVAARGYAEFFHDRMGGASKKNLYSTTAALCWTDSAQHGRQAGSENARMSGRVDAVRIKKPSFYTFQTMQSNTPKVHILGHWSYPKESVENYRYPLKEFNGLHFIKTGEYAYRNPKDKTVYVVGSYHIHFIKLYLNGTLLATCDTPTDTFIFPFHHIDITQSGILTAKGYDFNNNLVSEHTLHTAITPHTIRLTAHQSVQGLLADGSDIAYVDVEVLDERGVICPLSYHKIDFELEGEGVFLGGYNSGKFNGYGKDDSVIHQNHVYAECGINRVFIRSTRNPGSIQLKAILHLSENGVSNNTIQNDTILNNSMQNHITLTTSISLNTIPVDCTPLSTHIVTRLWEGLDTACIQTQDLISIPSSDLTKYKAEDKIWCKILLNGSEIDTQGVRCIYENNSVWGPILVFLNKLRDSKVNTFIYEYDDALGILKVETKEYLIEAELGRTHMLVNGEENLLNGQPYRSKEGHFSMEVNAILSYIEGVHSVYDENVNVYRLNI